MTNEITDKAYVEVSSQQGKIVNSPENNLLKESNHKYAKPEDSIIIDLSNINIISNIKKDNSGEIQNQVIDLIDKEHISNINVNCYHNDADCNDKEKLNSLCKEYSIHSINLENLTSNSYINDQLINFFIDYNIFSDNNDNADSIDKFFNFTSLFYTSIYREESLDKKFSDIITEINDLEEKNVKRLTPYTEYRLMKHPLTSYDKKQIRNWRKRVNKFSSNIWIIPINEKAHWSLVLVLYPDRIKNIFEKEEEAKKKQSEVIIEKNDDMELLFELGNGFGESSNKELDYYYNKKETKDEKNCHDLKPKDFPCLVFLDSLGSYNIKAVNLVKKYIFYEYYHKQHKTVDHDYLSSLISKTHNMIEVIVPPVSLFINYIYLGSETKKLL